MLNILHTIAGLHPDSGGPARTVTSLVKYLGDIDGINAMLATQQYNGDKTYTGSLSADKIDIAVSSSRIAARMGLPVYRGLPGLVARFRPRIIHDHGIWLPTNHLVARLAAREQILRVVHPRGMLEPWAISYRSYRKKLAWSLYQKRDIDTASLLIATSEAEAENIRRLGIERPIATIPNGVALPEYDCTFGQEKPQERQRSLLFLSRIHPVKGLFLLLDAWALVRPVGWTLKIAGPDEQGHLREVLAYASRINVIDSVEYLGVVDGEAKEVLFRDADVFVLPSLSENFGVVVAEALAHAVPVIATKGTPWNNLQEESCGWWVEAEPGALAAALRAAIAAGDNERAAMGSRGNLYARQFDWGAIAHDTLDVYLWLLGEAERPASVRLD